MRPKNKETLKWQTSPMLLDQNQILHESILKVRLNKIPVCFSFFAPRNAVPCTVPPGAHALTAPLPAATGFK